MYVTFKDIMEWLRPISLSTFAKRERVMNAARALISYYYYFVPFVAFLYAANPISSRENFDPIWTLSWVHLIDIQYTELVILLKIIFVAIGALCVLFYRHRAMRLLLFLTLLQVHALESSFSTINHQWYLWLYTSFIFVFLPNIWSVRTNFEKNRIFLLHIWLAQAIAMLTYFMAGMWKFFAVIEQSLAGEVHGFAIDAFAYQVANWVPRLQAEAVLAPYVIAYPEIGWPFYAGLHLLQLFALWIMVRTSLQKIWAVLFVIFHTGTLLAMGIEFHPLVVLIIILFLGSPFCLEKVPARELIRDLPIIGQLVEYFEANGWNKLPKFRK